MNKTPDISAYPIVRIDQIVLLDDAMLDKTCRDAQLLLNSLRNDEPSSQMIFYIQKQLDSMRCESGRRAAEKRVSKLLAGAEEALNFTSTKPISK